MKNQKNQRGFMVQGIIALLALIIIAGGAYYMGTRNRNKVLLNPISTEQMEQNTWRNNSDITKICSNAGMSIIVPNQLNYQCNTQVPQVFGNGVVALSVGYKDNPTSIESKEIISIYKFSNKAMFDESIPQGQYSDYILVNKNYKIDGTISNYYNSKRSIMNVGENLIVIPSKLIIILIAPASYTGITQKTLDQILSSFKFTSTQLLDK